MLRATGLRPIVLSPVRDAGEPGLVAVGDTAETGEARIGEARVGEARIGEAGAEFLGAGPAGAAG